MANEAVQLTLEDVDELRALVEAGMHDEAEAALQKLAGRFPSLDRQSKVFEEVGTLTRDLHNAIKDFAEDKRLRVIANVDMPRASERLTSIISMTGNAANKTLDAVDACQPIVDKLNDSVEKLLPAWSALMHGRINRDNFVSLCKNVDTLIRDTKKNAAKVSEQLTTILMAQDYQDLTGQMIQKVISLVAEVEDKLLKFLMNFSESEREYLLEKDELQSGIEPHGPALDSIKQSDNIAANQDEVDDLLASLGF